MKREKWIDILKGFAIICVVLEHAFERTLVYIDINNVSVDILRMIIKTFQMAVFFSASGYIYASRERTELIASGKVSKFIKKNVWDLYLPYCFFAILIWFGKFLFSDWVKYQVSGIDLIMMFVQPISFAWFLYALFVYKIIIAVIDTKLKKGIYFELLVGAIATIITAIIVDSEADINKVIYYFFFYVLGIAICEFKLVDNKLVGILLFAVYGILFVLFFKNQTIVILFAILGAIFVLALFSTMKGFNITNCPLLAYLGCNSLYIYIMHPVIESGVRVLFVKLGFLQPLWWVLIMTMVGIILPICYVLLSQRIWILNIPFKPRKYLMEFKKDKKDEYY